MVVVFSHFGVRVHHTTCKVAVWVPLQQLFPACSQLIGFFNARGVARKQEACEST